MHLLFTGSMDVTSDLIVRELGDKVIRLNNDRPADQKVTIGPGGWFEIADAHGRIVNSNTLVTAIFRKPSANVPKENEARFAFRENTAAHAALLHLIERNWPEKVPISQSRSRDITKFVQMQAAEGIFNMPEWRFATAPSECTGINDDVVIKTLTGAPFSEHQNKGGEKFIYVQKTRRTDLADGWPWFIQEVADFRCDVTVLYVDGDIFTLSLDRTSFDGVDWRRHIGTDTDRLWALATCPEHYANKIRSYMDKLGLRFGRLDFLSKDLELSELVFLEVNPNGQWAWMDLNFDKGIFSRMIDFLTHPKSAG